MAKQRFATTLAGCVALALLAGSVEAQTMGRVDPQWLRNYEEGVRENLRAYLRATRIVDPSAIRIQVRGETVTLSGEVPDVATRDQVLFAARETSGVQQVIDRLTIGGSTEGAVLTPRQPRVERRPTTLGQRLQ